MLGVVGSQVMTEKQACAKYPVLKDNMKDGRFGPYNDYFFQLGKNNRSFGHKPSGSSRNNARWLNTQRPSSNIPKI